MKKLKISMQKWELEQTMKDEWAMKLKFNQYQYYWTGKNVLQISVSNKVFNFDITGASCIVCNCFILVKTEYK